MPGPPGAAWRDTVFRSARDDGSERSRSSLLGTGGGNFQRRFARLQLWSSPVQSFRRPPDAGRALQRPAVSGVVGRCRPAVRHISRLPGGWAKPPEYPAEATLCSGCQLSVPMAAVCPRLASRRLRSPWPRPHLGAPAASTPRGSAAAVPFASGGEPARSDPGRCSAKRKPELLARGWGPAALRRASAPRTALRGGGGGGGGCRGGGAHCLLQQQGGRGPRGGGGFFFSHCNSQLAGSGWPALQHDCQPRALDARGGLHRGGLLHGPGKRVSSVRPSASD